MMEEEEEKREEGRGWTIYTLLYQRNLPDWDGTPG